MPSVSAPTEPGGRAPAPDPDLQLLQRFVNTNDVEAERDEIGTPARLQAWLLGLGATGVGAVDADAHARAIGVREGFRALGEANNEEPMDRDRLARLNAVAADLPLVASVSDADRWQLEPAGNGLDGFLARMLATLLRSMADGSWSRMKACRNHDCHWLFYDHSRNRSGTWCTMAICGSRAKARAYRARRSPGNSGRTMDTKSAT